MKRLLLVVCLLLSSLASASDYITVIGSGISFDEARQQAFRKAIEFKVGATVLSDVETKNYQRVKDEIYIYSSGYVDDYKILKQENTNNGIILLLDVKISESKIKNRIISEGESSKEVDGARHNAQLVTYMQEREQGDRLLDKLLMTYPSRAYKIQQTNYTITVDYYRNATMNIPYVMTWNYEFVQTLREISNTTENCKPSWNKPCASVVNIRGKSPTDILFGTASSHYFNDVNRNNQIHNIFVDNSPRIVARFYDLKGNYVYGTCHTPKFIWGGSEAFYSDGSANIITINTSVREASSIQATIPLEVIDKTAKIELAVEAKSICQN